MRLTGRKVVWNGNRCTVLRDYITGDRGSDHYSSDIHMLVLEQRSGLYVDVFHVRAEEVEWIDDG